MTKKDMFGLEDKFFRPVWIRIVVVAACVAWGAFEYVSGSLEWAALFIGVGAYAAYRLFITFNPKD